MKKVALYSLLLVAGLIGSQFLAGTGTTAINLLTMFCLSFIMLHVGCEFDIDQSQPGRYVWDYVVAGTAAAFPWIFCALYFVFVMAPASMRGSGDLWKEALLEARFASPTSAGVLFAMLAAAGLGSTWVFKKARVLAIFDDLDTILLMVPLKIMMVGLKWQLLVIIVIIFVLLGLAWKFLHRVRLPVNWPFAMVYAALITAGCEGIYLGSKIIDDSAPVQLEVLLPAFVLGCMLAHPEGHGDGLEAPAEKRMATIISGCFMVLVGLSMPPIFGNSAAAGHAGHAALHFPGVAPEVLAQKSQFPGWPAIWMHVLLITVLSNIGKLFPAFCYRREAPLRERLALAIGMFPRGEVGAGVLVISLSYGLGGPSLTVAVLSLALNLLCTGLFIAVVKKLIGTRT